MQNRFYLLLFLIVVGFSCKQKQEELPQVPEVFRLGYQPPEENIEEKVTRLRAFADFLEMKLEMPVELIEVLGYAPAIEALKSNKIEVTNLGSFGYVIAEDKAGVEPLAYRGHKDTGKGLYYSYCITGHPDINNIEDLKKNIHQLKLTFGNPASTSGHLIPKKYLSKLGIFPEDFKEVLHSPDHVASLMAVLTRNVDIAVIQNTTVDRFIASGKVDKDAVKILFQSDPIQTGPYVIRPNLPNDFKEKVRQALLDVCVEAPDIWKAIRSISDDNIILLPADKSLWDEIREMAQQTKKEMFF